MYTEKINSLVILLWESERESIELRKRLDEQDAIIKDLQADIYFAELEQRDMQQMLDNSKDVTYMHQLQKQVDKLSRENKRLQTVQSAFKC